MGNTHPRPDSYKKTPYNNFKAKTKKRINSSTKDILYMRNKQTKAIDKIMRNINSRILDLNELNEKLNNNEINKKSFENQFKEIQIDIEALSNAMKNAKQIMIDNEKQNKINNSNYSNKKVRFSKNTNKGGTGKRKRKR
jgi:hypothetical protein